MITEEAARESVRTALTRFTVSELGGLLTKHPRTIMRWVDGYPIEGYGAVHAACNWFLTQLPQAPAEQGTPAAPTTFIDLFAGIGGTRLGWQTTGSRCVFTSEMDKYCVQTYRHHFRPEHEIVGDIRTITRADDSQKEIARRIPDHDVLVAGFPCQPFSIAGVSKKNALGHAHGFECDTQGTLFFDICKILEVKRPIAFMLENVRNLKSHDKGTTFKVIMRSLEEDLGYKVYPMILDARRWVPQHRERIFLVGFREQTGFDWKQLEYPSGENPTLSHVLHPEDSTESADNKYTFGPLAKVAAKYTLTPHLWKYLKDYKAKHEAAGNGFGYGRFEPSDVARTLSARYYKDGSEILIKRGRKTPRRLTPRECARLMGFPKDFGIPVSDTQAYKQFGNSVVVPVVEAVAKAMYPHVVALRERESNALQIAMPM